MKKALHAKPFRLQMPGHTPRHARPEPARSKLLRGVSLCLAAVCLAASVSFQPATAATSMASLQNKLNSLSKSIDQHKKELSDAKKKEAAAKALESELKERVGVIQSQISVLSTQIAAVQNNIGQTEQKITAKEGEITQKQAEIDSQWGDFKKHMAAMQELRDGGGVAMLSAVNDLYELLTFNEVMQDISIKDTEIMDNMKAAKSELEADKVELEAQRKELQSQKAELDTQNYQMKAKQSELNSSISAAQLSAQDAQKAQQTAQAAIESDELNYEAVKKEIQKLIAAAASSKPQLSFTGFACPLKSYTRVSSEYGWRKNPVSGVNKLHAGSRKRLCAGGGLVQRRLWQLCHHLPRKHVGRQRLQYLVRPHEVGRHQRRQVCQAGRVDRLRWLYRQLYRQPPASGGLEGRQKGQCGQSARLYPVPAQLSVFIRSLVFYERTKTQALAAYRLPCSGRRVCTLAAEQCDHDAAVLTGRGKHEP